MTYIDNVEKMRNSSHGYVLADHKISIIPSGIHYLEELDKKKAIVRKELTDIWLDELYSYDDKKKKAKFVYEVVNL